MIEVIINNKSYKFEKVITVLQACEQANIIVPRFCYNEKLSVAGSCRMCLVEIEKSPKPVASCAMPISNGMCIFTDTPLVKKAQESVVEGLLINHPLDCPICDQAGECDLQDITLNYGSDRSRFYENKRGVEDKSCGPIVKTIMTRCIHCTRCVRFLSELTGVESESFGSFGRGEDMEIGTYVNKYIDTELSGNLVDLCPVGALTSKPYAFLGRSWELKSINSIDFSDALGSNIVVQTRNSTNNNKNKNLNNDNIVRILPRLNENINETWISDKTRYAFDGINNLRLEKPLFWGNSIDWNTIIKDFSNDFEKKILDKKLFVVNNGHIVSIEDFFFFSLFLNQYGINNFLINDYLYNINTDLPAFYRFNSQIKNIEESDLILLIGINPRYEASMLNLKIRKHFFNKNVSVNLIGSYIDLTYPINHLGNSTKTLLNIVEGKNDFCIKLRKSKNPLIIVGSEIALRADSLTIQNLVRILSKKSFLLFKNKLNLNYVHSNLAQSNSSELGLTSNAKSIVYLFNKYKINKEFYMINNNINELNKFEKMSYCSLNTHRFEKDVLNKYLFPIDSFYEKNSINFNIEGVLQKGFKSKTQLQLSKSMNILTNNIDKIIKKNNNLNLQLSLEKFGNSAKFLKYNLPGKTQKFLNIFKIQENSNKLNFSKFKPIISNFYMTDNITKNSKIMSNCTLFLKDKVKNFKKIY